MNKYSAREDLEFIKKTNWWQSADGSNAPLGLMIGLFVFSWIGFPIVSFVCFLGLMIVYSVKLSKKSTLMKVLKKNK